MGKTVAMPKTDEDYRVRDAAETLMRAEAIKQDKKLLKAARAELLRRTQQAKAAMAD